MSRCSRITYIYWPIECTSKTSFVHVFELTGINSPIECSQKLDLLRCSRLQRCKITLWTEWMCYMCNSQICVLSSYIHLGRKVPWLHFFQRIKGEASHHVCLRVSFLILDLLFVYNLHLSTKSCVIVYGHDLWTTTHTWSMVNMYKKSGRIQSQVEYTTLGEFTTWSHSLAPWHNCCPHICKRGTSASECFHGNQEVLQNSVTKKPRVHVMTTDAGLNRLGISMDWIFPFRGVTLLYSFWLISRNPWFWDFLRLL